MDHPILEIPSLAIKVFANRHSSTLNPAFASHPDSSFFSLLFPLIPILSPLVSCIPMKYSNPRISALLQILKFFSERPYPFFLPFYIFPFRCQQYIFLKFFRCCINLFYIFMNPKDGSCPRKLV